MSTPNEHDTERSGAAERLFESTPTLVSTYGPALSDSVNRLSDVSGMTQAERDAHVVEMAEAFNDAAIMPSEAAKLHWLVVQHLATKPEDATVDQWAADARRQLRERYGLEEGQRRLELAKQFVDNRPELAKLLGRTGVGSHPDVVLALAENPNLLRVTPRKRR